MVAVPVIAMDSHIFWFDACFVDYFSCSLSFPKVASIHHQFCKSCHLEVTPGG